MKFVADLHIHSHYSRATSKDLTLEHLWKWAQIKGVTVVATGDISHPGWLAELQQKLAPAEPGLFRLKDEFAAVVADDVPLACRGEVRFLLGGEISNIYKRHGKTRKVHNLIFAPDLDTVGRLQARLERIGNIRSDGRPILGLDSRDLLEITLETHDRCRFIPAHIWTPWFAMLGSMSGFNSVEECFGDLTPHIFALETGLSSDPPMNWRVSNLDRYTLVSNSDAHSPPKLAREATCFDCDLSYDALFAALQSGDPATFNGTIEFFPEEGKYHVDGHRKCGVCWQPVTTLAHDKICPVCGKEVTVGVLHRIEMLADRPEDGRPARTHPYASLIPLPEVLGELLGVGAGSQRVQREYVRLLARLGSELTILRETRLEEIAAAGGDALAQGIARMRRGAVDALPGYDGEYGVVRVFSGAAAAAEAAQIALFQAEPARVAEPAPVYQPPATAKDNAQTTAGVATPTTRTSEQHAGPEAQAAANPPANPIDDSLLAGLNQDQRAAVLCIDAPLIISAGPGTGKTRTLTVRIAHLIRQRGAAPEAVLAITFTNKAAAELRARLAALLGEDVAARATVKTFHAFGAQLLRAYAAEAQLDPNFVIIDEEERRQLLARAAPAASGQMLDAALDAITAAKQQLCAPPADFAALFHAYNAALREAGAVDFDDLIALAVTLLERSPAVAAAVQHRYRWLSVDEYQDVNQAQVRFLSLLAAGRANLCVIGDPDQAIYGFRGADRRYFLSFVNEYPGARQVHLTQNYRSSQGILDAARQVIAHNPDRTEMPLLAQFADAVKLDVHAAPTDKAEAETVVHQIEQMVGGTSYFSLDTGRADGLPAAVRDFSEFAVLYRLNAQARPLIEAFDRSGIPYQVVGQASLWAGKTPRRVLALLWLLHNPRSAVHLEQMLDAAGLTTPADAALRLHTLLTTGSYDLATALREFAITAPPRERQRAETLATFWPALASARPTATAGELVERICIFWGVEDDVRGRLMSRTIPFGARLVDFLEAARLESEADAYDPRADRVTLTTIHAAKGLEFPVVFVVGCEENLLPYVREGTPTDVEEERRLFYVGMTRAREKLVLTHANGRFLLGKRLENAPSRFVGEIEAALLAWRDREPRSAQKAHPIAQLGLFGG
jgi:DNA helicase-2/ATP-dependent DNA helicase PcrA